MKDLSRKLNCKYNSEELFLFQGRRLDTMSYTLSLPINTLRKNEPLKNYGTNLDYFDEIFIVKEDF